MAKNPYRKNAGDTLHGLTPAQRIKVRAILPNRGTHDGWTIYRSPTTGTPTTLRLHYRNDVGRLCQVVSITENGVTK